jgi:3D (Asp-Asp-Asp) domain-containing protein
LTVLLIGALLQLVSFLPHQHAELARGCREARITGYVRTDPAMNDWTADGTSIYTDEPIAAASYDIPMDSMVYVEGLGTYRVADRGMLAPTHIDIAITGVRTICITESM